MTPEVFRLTQLIAVMSALPDTVCPWQGNLAWVSLPTPYDDFIMTDVDEQTTFSPPLDIPSISNSTLVDPSAARLVKGYRGVPDDSC